jgi:tRNA nucleotidyltransferase (CCA-adding enzyme)
MPASVLYELLDGEPVEALAVALAWGAPGEPVLRYLSDVRGARLEVTGDDLLAAGVPQSPALGHALTETLRRKLDGEVSGRDAELKLAIELARAGA